MTETGRPSRQELAPFLDTRQNGELDGGWPVSAAEYNAARPTPEEIAAPIPPLEPPSPALRAAIDSLSQGHGVELPRREAPARKSGLMARLWGILNRFGRDKRSSAIPSAQITHTGDQVGLTRGEPFGGARFVRDPLDGPDAPFRPQPVGKPR